MQLIQDVYIMDNLQIIEEGSGKSKMKIRGTFQRAEEANNNGRIYPTKVLEGQIKKMQPLIEERRLCGELDHPQNDTVKLSNASHLVTKLHMEGNEVIGEAEILKTPAGLTAQALVNGGVKIGISSRGMGTLSEDANGSKIVNEDFNLVTFDLVADPSTRGAFPGLSESREAAFAKTTQGKLEKESNFITMLESKMRNAYQPWIEESRESKKTKAAREKAEAKKRAEAEEAQAETEAFKRTSMKDHFELVKADGHWHRIAEALAVAMGHEIDEAMSDFLDSEDTDTKNVTVTRKEKKEGHVSRALRQRSERKHAEKSAKGMAIAKAKGEAEGSKIAGKARRGEELKDVTAKGKQSREGIRQATKTHGKREKSKSAKARSTMAGEEQRAYDKTAGPMMRGSSQVTRSTVKGAKAAGGAVKGVAKKTGEGISKGAEASKKLHKWATDYGSKRANK